MAHLQSDLNEFVELLNSNKVDFIVVGGHAVAFHGHPRFTGDIDFLVRPNAENGKRIVQVLVQFGFLSLGVQAADFEVPEQVIQLGRPPNRIDLLTAISGVSFEEAWSTRVAGQLGPNCVSFLGLDALLKNKAATGRDKDREDVKKLRAIASRKRIE